MTYDSERIRLGREPCTIVEIDTDKCSNLYGGGLLSPLNGTCTAFAAAGSECHNTRKTCQDSLNYDNSSTLTYQFSDRAIPGETYIPCITKTKLSPVTITPGQPFGKRAVIKITFRDFAHHDRGFDPYISTRSYTAQDQGTFWGKFLARNPFYQGRALRLLTGYIADPFSTGDFETQNYIIEQIDGPDSKGVVTITAKDVLKLADDDRSQCPVASTGQLTGAITSSGTSLTVTSGSELDYVGRNLLHDEDFGSGRYTLGADWTISSGVLSHAAGSASDASMEVFFEVAGDYAVTFTMANRTGGTCSPNLKGGTQVSGTARSTNATFTETLTALAGNNLIAFTATSAGAFDISVSSIRKISEYLRIGDEIILAPYANRSANVFSNLTRGTWNTTAATHATDDGVQVCAYFNAENVSSIINDLIVNYARILPSYIPTADWETEKDAWLSGHNLTALITEPTGIKTLLDELSEQVMVYIWWDSKNQKIKLKAIAPPLTTLGTLTDSDNFLGDVMLKSKPDDRKSRVLVYYKPRTPIDFDKPKHFDSIYGTIEAPAESVNQYADIRLKEIFARWITIDSIAVTTSSRLLNQFIKTPSIVTFTLDAKDSDNVTGDFININTRRLQDASGQNLATLMQILSVEEMTTKAPGTHYKCIAQEAFFSGRYARIMSSGATSVYSSATDTEKAEGAYIAASGGGDFSDGGTGYRIA